MMEWRLNERAARLAAALAERAGELRIGVDVLPEGGRLLDCGIAHPGSLGAGLALAQLSMAGLGEVRLAAGPEGLRVETQTDQPWLACLASQFGGWSLKAGKFFAIGSGPMRAAAAHEPLFQKLAYAETATVAVGVLETRTEPSAEIVREISAKCRIPGRSLSLAVAPTASLAGTLQVVARSVETALHKLHELGFEVKSIVSAHGTAPLPPVGKDDLAGIGLTNDAILYGGQVTLWTEAADGVIEQFGPQVPSSASPMHGRPFAELFQAAGGDFYQIDPLLFSPAVVVFRSLKSGRTFRYGHLEPEVLRRSFEAA